MLQLLLSSLSRLPFSLARRKSQTILSRFRPLCTIPLQKPKWISNTALIITNPLLLTLESCNSMSELKQIQAQMTRTGLITHIFPVSRVLSFCALSDSGDLNHARIIFTQIAEPNIYMWNTMIRGYCKAKSPDLGFFLFRRMVREQVDMDSRTFVFVLKACEQFQGVMEGEELHCLIYKMGCDADLLIGNGLMHLYAKRGYLGTARLLFDANLERDVVSWTTMINGYAQNNLPDEALKLFNLMLPSAATPNDVTMVVVLSACSQAGDLSLGKSIHRYIEKKNVDCSLNLMNALMDMYVKCGCLASAKEIFDRMEARDVFSWTTMINGYARDGSLEYARKFFDEIPERNVVSWNAMISGYSQRNQPEKALELFHEMEKAHVAPIESTLVCVLSACGQSGCLDLGQWIHYHYVDQKRVKLSAIMANALIDMYAKCGNIDAAAKVFNMMPERDLVSWNSMIVGYAVHGYAGQALRLFDEMSKEIVPDDITFVGVLSACSHGGLDIQGKEYFGNMRGVFGIEPKAEHYACMIDLLGRVGLLEEANKLIKGMPMEPDEAAWGALLNACRMHGNVELGKLAADKLLHLDPKDSGIYALLANMYAGRRRWDDVRMVRSMMRDRGIKKTPGNSLIEVDGKIHEFLVADKSHPQSEEIYNILDEILLLLKSEGYVPNTSQLLGLPEQNEGNGRGRGTRRLDLCPGEVQRLLPKSSKKWGFHQYFCHWSI
ncbi:pentatricopeptide repeat-containing protein At2g22410, mitochondrial-like isoform X2 [Macadamia integrifolia]|uniref:pentatricopeptide repeat-containing protein At2g22410, mitochondrial-like isoform X2 n=1 Tax=Macadamia integrifolia TaxID=60698 RepID=UPI001C4F5654|nr:pentatricopeptide repeat-containing protein At2g22410, mitochondrial-like isoform X2 [Macadamia integrifolia]